MPCPLFDPAGLASCEVPTGDAGAAGTNPIKPVADAGGRPVIWSSASRSSRSVIWLGSFSAIGAFRSEYSFARHPLYRLDLVSRDKRSESIRCRIVAAISGLAEHLLKVEIPRLRRQRNTRSVGDQPNDLPPACRHDPGICIWLGASQSAPRSIPRCWPLMQQASAESL